VRGRALALLSLVLALVAGLTAALGDAAVVGPAAAATSSPACGAAPQSAPSNWPPVDIVAVPGSACGYWIVSSDGGIFAFGTAQFHGSMGGSPLDAPIMGMAAAPTGGGYWLVASDGGVFAFGTAQFLGSMGGLPLVKPVVAVAADPSTGGYWLVTADGGVFAFGAPFLGSMGGQPLHRPVVAGTGTGGGGYLMLGADGGVFNFGDAPFLGTTPGPPLAGTVIALDPGHDGGNGAAAGIIDQLIWNGVEEEQCDTVGSETPGGYPEHLFNWNVAQYLEADLRAQGATVVLTRNSDDGVGPCVDVRAAIANAAGATAAVSIHADGAPPTGRGFAVLEPVADGIDNAVVAPSAQLAVALRDAFATGTGEPVSTYDGVNGIQPRNDLGGLNLTTVPKVLIECANMQNPADAALLVQPAWQQQAAAAIAQGLSAFMADR
jgi:N-acetylmuramoyl-L-alanine amidase